MLAGETLVIRLEFDRPLASGAGSAAESA